MGMKRQLLPNFVFPLLAFASLGNALDVTLSHLSTIYLPKYTANGSKTYEFDANVIEKMAVQRQAKLIYGVGHGVIHIINATNLHNLTYVDAVLVPGLDLTDVGTCGEEAVVVAYHNDSHNVEGGVLVYRPYNSTSGSMPLLTKIPVGSLPDKVYPLTNCTVIVALENEGFVEGGQLVDLPGGVAIIRFPSGIAADPNVTVLGFTLFDAQFDRLSASGVRWPYRVNNNNFSDTVEPEGVTVNSDHTKAYISLQENNGIAVVDLTTDNITAIHGLGYKQWGYLDASDRDGGIHIQSWPLYGIYQPDELLLVHWNKEDYIITANEGDTLDYEDPVNFKDEIRGHDINIAEVDNVSESLKRALQNDTQLGRIKLSAIDGKNAEGKFERFYAFGGRSFSIRRASDMTLVYDSGSDLERQMAKLRPDIFNSKAKSNVLLAATKDTRSDDKGVEPESLEVAQLENHLLIFLGNENPGSIAVYSVAQDGMKPEFRFLYTGGIPRDSRRTWSQLYEAREIHSIDPESLKYLSPSDGLADFPVLLTVGTVSGTITSLRVNVTQPKGPASHACLAVIQTHTWFLLTMVAMFIVRLSLD